jgi:hypothetical protein
MDDVVDLFTPEVDGVQHYVITDGFVFRLRNQVGQVVCEQGVVDVIHRYDCVVVAIFIY